MQKKRNRNYFISIDNTEKIILFAVLNSGLSDYEFICDEYPTRLLEAKQVRSFVYFTCRRPFAKGKFEHASH